MNKRSNCNLNTKNNLANVFLKQRLAQFDREKKYHIYHIERNKVSTNHFLSQIKQCDNFITTDLLGRSKDRETKEVAKEEDEVDNSGKPPIVPSTKPKSSKSKCSQKRRTPSTPVRLGRVDYLSPGQRYKLQNLSAVRSEWMREGSKKKITDFERGERFLEKLRERYYIEHLQQNNTSDEEDDYNPLLRNAKSGITRLPSFRKPPNRPHSSDEWTARSRKSTEHLAERFHSTFENIRLEDENRTLQSEANVKLPRVPKNEPGPSVAWLGDGDDDEAEGGSGDEERPPQDMMRIFLNLKMKVRPRPLHSRIDDFYDKLDEMKKQQEERTRSLPYYEKRRRWLMLTRGKVDDFEESEVCQ